MVSDRQRYRAEVFKIGGFALMTPLGRCVLYVLDHGFRNISFDLFINFLTSSVLFVFGIIVIQIGYEEVFEE